MTGDSALGEPLVMGLLVTDLSLPAWQVCMLQRVRAEGLARIAVVVLGNHSRPHGLRAALERRALDARSVAKDAFASVDACGAFGGAEILRASPRVAMGLHASIDVERIGAYGLDVLLHLGGELPSGAILEAAYLGVWSYWSGDEPEGFWEVHENRSEIRPTLWRLTQEGAEALYESPSSVDSTCVATTRSRAYWKAAAFVPRVLRRLKSDGSGALAMRPAARARLPAERRPGLAALGGFLAKRFLLRRQAHFLKRVSREQWQLLYAFGPAARTDYECFTSMVPPADRGWADPHVVVRDGRHYVFIEEYSYTNGRGHLAVIELREDGTYGEPIRILERPYHLSYPHVFEWQGEFYMLPETKANRTIEIYRCTEFPHRWQLEANLMENVEALDSTLFEHGGRWWLFANLVENEGGSSWDELFLFSADSPLSRQWTPHPANPIVSDVTRARPAGRIFVDKGRIYRPSQDCSRRYGYGLNISEIVALDETRYQERIVTRVRPEWDPTIFATHTLAHGGQLTVIDGQRRRWRSPFSRSAWRAKWNRLRQCLAPSRTPPGLSTD